MNSLIVLFQAIFISILLVYYQSKIEVKAEHQKFTVSTWFSNLEKKLNAIQDVMQDVFHNVKQSARHIFPLPDHHIRKLPQVEELYHAVTVADSEAKIYSDYFENDNIGADSENLKNIIKSLSNDASDISESKNEENFINEAGISGQEEPLKKTKVKKHKMSKSLRTRISEDKEESDTKVKSKRKKKHGNRTFVKTAVSQFNNSDSNESRQKGKPVDIIVHIKMNE